MAMVWLIFWYCRLIKIRIYPKMCIRTWLNNLNVLGREVSSAKISLMVAVLYEIEYFVARILVNVLKLWH